VLTSFSSLGASPISRVSTGRYPSAAIFDPYPLLHPAWQSKTIVAGGRPIQSHFLPPLTELGLTFTRKDLRPTKLTRRAAKALLIGVTASIPMPHSDSNTESSAPDPPNHNTEQTASVMASNRPSRGSDGHTENNGARAANSSTYLSDYMSPNTDDEQQRSTNGVTPGSGGSGQHS
jgi:hypothetical protein